MNDKNWMSIKYKTNTEHLVSDILYVAYSKLMSDNSLLPAVKQCALHI